MTETDWSDIEFFLNKGVRKKNPFVSICRDILRFNLSCIRENFSENDTYIILSYSKKNHAISMQLTDDKDHEYGIKIYKHKTGWLLSIKSFLNHFGLENVSGRYTPTCVEIPNLGKRLVIYLDNKIGDLTNP